MKKVRLLELADVDVSALYFSYYFSNKLYISVCPAYSLRLHLIARQHSGYKIMQKDDSRMDRLRCFSK